MAGSLAKNRNYSSILKSNDFSIDGSEIKTSMLSGPRNARMPMVFGIGRQRPPGWPQGTLGDPAAAQAGAPVKKRRPDEAMQGIGSEFPQSRERRRRLRRRLCRVYPFPHPYARAKALMARQWSASCYGVARQRDGSRQNSIGLPLRSDLGFGTHSRCNRPMGGPTSACCG
jgi:hypothetical protein